MTILDDFNRANEGPPPSANWTNMPGAMPPAIDSGLRVVSNACANGGGALDTSAGYWNPSTFSADQEAQITVTTLPVLDNYGLGVYLRTLPGTDTAGYMVDWAKNRGTGGVIDAVVIWRLDPFENIQQADLAMGVGDTLRVTAIGTTITVYHTPFGGSESLITSVVDATTNRVGYIGAIIYGSTVRADDFGGGGSGPIIPAADFSGTPTSGTAGLSVDFTDLSTGSPTSWLWDFGDGDVSTDQNPTHVYAAIGTYTVALTATNGDGSDTETKVDYITVIGAPVADFSGTPTSGNVALSVDFTDLSTNSPTSWFWDFGDGGSSTSQNPTYVYNYIGVYTVTLTATSSSGSDSETKVAYITVNAVPEVGPAEVEDCDTNTGGLAVGLRVSNVALARDNWLGSLTIDASAELRAKDNSYSTLINNGTLTSLVGDKAVWDTDNFAAGHAKDIDDATGQYHLVSAATQAYTISNPSTDRAYDVTATTLNELAAIVGTLIADLKAKGLLS